MDKSVSKRAFDPRILLRAAAAWGLSALVLLLLSAAIITVADLKASSFHTFSLVILLAAAFCVGFSAKRGSAGPTWRTGLFSAVALTIVLLTLGFLIASDQITAEGILRIAICDLIGCFLGAIAAANTKKLQKRQRRPRKKK